VGWELDRTLAGRLTIAALEREIESRQPPPGLVHHSDRGVQYACEEYVTILERNRIVPSMSRPANPYDNASCESFIKTLKREEIYANKYEDLEHLRANIEELIDQSYNRQRLHSALGYRSPEEFEQRSHGMAAESQCMVRRTTAREKRMDESFSSAPVRFLVGECLVHDEGKQLVACANEQVLVAVQLIGDGAV
jgi:hypothetical protein